MATPNSPYEEGCLAGTEGNKNCPYFEDTNDYNDWWVGYHDNCDWFDEDDCWG